MERQPTLDLQSPRTDDAAPGAPQRESRHRRPTREYACVERPGPHPESGRTRFGEWLVHRGVLTREVLLQVLATSHIHDWRIGDAVVVLRIASRKRVEAEAGRFERNQGLYETCRHLLERALRLERESRHRRIRRTISGGTHQGQPRSSA